MSGQKWSFKRVIVFEKELRPGQLVCCPVCSRGLCSYDVSDVSLVFNFLRDGTVEVLRETTHRSGRMSLGFVGPDLWEYSWGYGRVTFQATGAPGARQLLVSFVAEVVEPMEACRAGTEVPMN